jgi:hypothetical protein
MGCSFKFLLKVGFESTVNAPRDSAQTTQKVRLHLKNCSVMRNPWCAHNRLLNANFEKKFKCTPYIISMNKIRRGCRAQSGLNAK